LQIRRVVCVDAAGSAKSQTPSAALAAADRAAPPYPALSILAGPLAVVEPLKLAIVFIAGQGHWSMSGLVMLFAYAVSLFVTHWLFVVVKPKLLALPWFARAWARFVALRDRAWRWVA